MHTAEANNQTPHKLSSLPTERAKTVVHLLLGKVLHVLSNNIFYSGQYLGSCQPVWPDGLTICSIIGQLQHWKLSKGTHFLQM